MPHALSDIAFTQAVKNVQTRLGSRQHYAHMEEQDGGADRITPELAAFLRERDSFYFATASATGRPYIQHRGGPKGFLHVLDDHTLAFADFKGNRQYISLGNLAENAQAFLFLMDYVTRTRIKIWGTAEVIEDNPLLLSQLAGQQYRGKPERIIRFRVGAWDMNCRQHIPKKYSQEDIEAVVQPLPERLGSLEAENASLKKTTHIAGPFAGEGNKKKRESKITGHFRETFEKGDKSMTTFVQSDNQHTLPLHETFPKKEQALHQESHMSQDIPDWVQTFKTLFHQKVTFYNNGLRNVEGMFSKEEQDFLRSIGATPQEIFDFVEDWCEDGEPDLEMVVAITKIRRDFFVNMLHGQFPKLVRNIDLFPPREASLAGLPWFPRIIEKARAKLLGELPSDLMYSCGGDRKFLKKVNVRPDEFLQVVWEAGDDVEHIIQFVTDRAKK